MQSSLTFTDASRLERVTDAPLNAWAKRNVPRLTDSGCKELMVPETMLNVLQAEMYGSQFVSEEQEQGRSQESFGVANMNPGDTGPSISKPSEYLTSVFRQWIKMHLEEWSGVSDLIHSYTYGPRMYHPGALLFSHVDKPATHVLSATVCLENKGYPWPICMDVGNDVIQSDTVTGKVLLYESARCPHWRARPLDGGSCSMVFIHFTYDGWDVVEPDLETISLYNDAQ